MAFKEKFFSLLILEATREDIKKYYPQINDSDYETILDGDPTGTKNKIGSLSRLVLDLYKKDKFNIKSEQLRDTYAAFDLIQKKKNGLIGSEFEKFRNLNSIPDVKTLMDINYYLSQKASGKIKLKIGDGENVEVFHEDETWKVLIPLDYQSSVKIGRDVKAEWCTASSKAETHYNRYIVQNDLYIFINKETNEAYQYFDHGEKNSIEFNNIKNVSCSLDQFVEKNNLEKVLDRIEAESKKIWRDSNHWEKRLFLRYSQSKSPYIVLAILKTKPDLVEKLFKIHTPDLNKKLVLSSGFDGEKSTTLNMELYLANSKQTTLVYNKELIVTLCEKYNIKKYNIQPNLTVDVIGNVNIGDKDLLKIPIKFGVISGSFDCSANKNLKSLEWAPERVRDDFVCLNCGLESLKYAPEVVGGAFSCSHNDFTSLEGAPKKVGRGFSCSDCRNLTSLKGAPEEVGNFYCSGCPSLKSLKHAPKIVRGMCFVGYNDNLLSLEGGPLEVGDAFDCSWCIKLESLKGAPVKTGGSFKCYGCKNLENLEGSSTIVGNNFFCGNENLSSLKGVPKTIGGDFHCSESKVKFSPEDVKAICDVKGSIST